MTDPKKQSEGNAPRRMNSLEDRNKIVESALDEAIKRGDFDDLPGMGKPLKGLHRSNDPDWWIKQKMDREDMSGIAPAAFQLRKESAGIVETLDALRSEAEVRDYLVGFNARVREAIMDLRDGPPVFTPPRDIDAEVAAWRRRRAVEAMAADETDNGERLLTGPASTGPATASEARSTGLGPEAPPRRRRWWSWFRRR